MSKLKTVLLALACVSTNTLAHKKTKFDYKLVKNNAFIAISNIVSKAHPEFHPKSSDDLDILRIEKNGIIDFLYTSKNGKFRGNVFCSLSELILYKKDISVYRNVCFRANIHKFDSKAINYIGNQVGIY